MFGTESGDRGEVHAHKDTTCFSLVWVLQRPPARTLQNAIIDSQQVEKKEGRKQTEILLKKDFDVEVGLEHELNTNLGEGKVKFEEGKEKFEEGKIKFQEGKIKLGEG